MEPVDGIDGPYSVPFKMQEQTVKAEWIDYNGHMNVAYYTLAFDLSLDEFFENILGLGPSYVARSKSGPYSLQAQYHYLDELLQGGRFYVKVYVKDFRVTYEPDNRPGLAEFKESFLHVELTLSMTSDVMDEANAIEEDHYFYRSIFLGTAYIQKKVTNSVVGDDEAA